MKITVVYNRVDAVTFGKQEDIIADNDTVMMAKEVAKALTKRGHKVGLLELNEKTISTLAKIKTDCFFNLCGGIDGLPRSESLAAGALIKTGFPVVGSTKEAINLTTDKPATKKILLANNLPTPKFIVVPDHGANLDGLLFPLILKPAAEDCSLGISQESVFKNKNGISRKVQKLLELYRQPVLVEEFIDGRELRVSIIGNGIKRRVLPISELVFGKSFQDKFRIFDFSAKWRPETDLYKDTYAISPAKISREVKKYVEEISQKAFELTGCTDYGRVDIRLDKNNDPYILEVNANPAIGPQDALASSAAAAGLSYGELLEEIILSHENNHHL